MNKTTDDSMEDDIREISSESIGPAADSQCGEAPASPIDPRIIECIEEATRPYPEWLRDKWADKKSARQIAQETGEPLETVFRMLKEMEKAVVKALKKENGH